MKAAFIKSTGPNGTSIHKFAHFHLPTVDGPGAWMEPCANRQPLKPHFWGYHLALPDYISDWFGIENYWAEHDGEIVEGHGCVVARSIRLIEPIPSTNEQFANIAVKLLEPVVGLIRDMHFPQAFTSVIEPAYDKIITWLGGNDSIRADACGLAEMAITLAGRNIVDSHASYEWMANSEAATYVATSVGLLAHLERIDGQRLIEGPIEKKVRRTLVKPLPRLLHQMGTGVVGLPESNFRVAKNICGFTAKAAKASVEQMMWHNDNHLTERQRHWIAAARVSESAPLDYQALSGMRAKQSQVIADILGFNMSK